MVKNITFNDGNSIPQLGYGVCGRLRIMVPPMLLVRLSKQVTATLIPHPFMGTRLG